MLTTSLRLGIVPFLNVQPLLEGLGQTYPEANWCRATPRELAALLERGQVDVATLPIFEALRGTGYRLVPGCAIASDGPVRSVQLYSKVPLSRIQAVLMDRRSLTSVHLAQVLFARPGQLWRLSPEPIAEGHDFAADPHDAFVLIGDLALRLEKAFPHSIDLGAAWRERTGLPFVFAAWTIREGLQLTPDDLAAFVSARERGEAACDHITRRDAPLFGVPPERAADYLGKAIRFRLGARELEAISAFRQLLIQGGFLPASSGEPRLFEPTARVAQA